MKDNCFTEFCCFLSNLSVNQPWVYIYLLPFWNSLLSPTLSHSSRLIQSPCLSFMSHTAKSCWLSILRMVMEVSMLLFPYISPSPWGFPGGSEVKVFACNVGDLGLIPGSGRHLEKKMATHSSILAWRIPWTEEPGGLQSTGSQRVGHD